MEDKVVTIGKILGIPTRKKIFDVLRESDDNLNITEIYNKLKKSGYDISYKNVAGNLKIMKDMGLINFKEEKTLKGRETLAIPSWKTFFSSKPIDEYIYKKGTVNLFEDKNIPRTWKELFPMELMMRSKDYIITLSLSDKRKAEIKKYLKKKSS